MDSLETLIWIVFIVGTVFYNLVQHRKKKERRQDEAARAGMDAGAPQPVPHPKLPVTYRELPPRVPPVPLRRVQPSPWAETGWGRQAETLESPSPEDIAESVAAPLPVEVPVAPSRVMASTASPRKSLAQPLPRERLLRTRQEVRAAVVGMTVLGPCRALVPYEEPDGAGPTPRQRAAIAPAAIPEKP